MVKIQSLLNPQASSENGVTDSTAPIDTFNPPLTPSLTSETSDASLSPSMRTPDVISPVKRAKLAKASPVFVKGEAKARVNYPPYESNEDAICLSPDMREELIQQHQRFKIFPSGSEEDGLISDFVRRIPYSSDKNQSFGKTGWEGFDVYQYTFIMPEDDTKKDHTVMWDYNTGLVRITPFFKACKYFKTTPAKALNANPGLKEMSYSVTGGALVAQGYWMPYACARAICLTFAYPIRWALTPIFGPSFVRECLKTDQPGFERFKIDPETIRCSRMAMEELTNAGGVHYGQGQGQGYRTIPRSVPEQHLLEQQYQHEQTIQAGRLKFKQGSPFDSESETSISNSPCGLGLLSALNSPAISPKTTTFDIPGWASINNPLHRSGTTAISSAPPSPPPNTPHSTLDPSLLFLTEPSYGSWRPDTTSTTSSPTITTSTNVDANTKASTMRARRSSETYPDIKDSDNALAYSSPSNRSTTASEDEMDIVDAYSKPMLRPGTNNAGGHGSPYIAASRSAGVAKAGAKGKDEGKGKGKKKYTAADFRAARRLLELSQAN